MNPFEAIFHKLLLVYGKRFTDAYVGQSADTIRAHWQHELRGVSEEGIAYALQHLPPDHPPNVLQFRRIANERPLPMRALIPMDRKHRPVPAAVKQKLAAIVQAPADPLRWAKSLQRRERNGEHLTRVQREAWRKALRKDSDEARETQANADAQATSSA